MPLIPTRCPNCNKYFIDIYKVGYANVYANYNPSDGSYDEDYGDYEHERYECQMCGETISDDFIEEWRRQSNEVPGEVARALIAEYERERMQNNDYLVSPISQVSNNTLTPNQPNNFEENDINELSARRARNPHNNLTAEERQQMKALTLACCPNCFQHQITSEKTTICTKCNTEYETINNLVPYATKI